MAATLFFGFLLPLIFGGILWLVRPDFTAEWFKGYCLVFVPITFAAGVLGNMLPAAILAIVSSGVILLFLLVLAGKVSLSPFKKTPGVVPARLDALLAAKTPPEADAEIQKLFADTSVPVDTWTRLVAPWFATPDFDKALRVYQKAQKSPVSVIVKRMHPFDGKGKLQFLQQSLAALGPEAIPALLPGCLVIAGGKGGPGTGEVERISRITSVIVSHGAKGVPFLLPSLKKPSTDSLCGIALQILQDIGTPAREALPHLQRMAELEPESPFLRKVITAIQPKNLNAK